MNKKIVAAFLSCTLLATAVLCGFTSPISEEAYAENMTDAVIKAATEIAQDDIEKISMITGILGITYDDDDGIVVDLETLEFFNDAELFGYDGSVGAKTNDPMYVTKAYWVSDKEYGISNEYEDIINKLKSLYGECSLEDTDYEGILANAFIWTDDVFDCNMVVCGLNEADGNDKIAIYWIYDISTIDETENPTENDDENSAASLSTMEEIVAREKKIIEEYEPLFEDAGLEYEVTPNGAVLLGTELTYQILDRNYISNEIVSAEYSYYKNAIEIGVSTLLYYHEEKGLDKENPHLKLVYNILSYLGAYTSIDDMIADMEEEESWSGSAAGGTYKWTNSNNVLKFSYESLEDCSYEETINYCALESMDEREEKYKEYSNLVDERVGDKTGVAAYMRDEWQLKSLSLEQPNNLGILVTFSNIATSPEYIDSAREVVEIYIDTAFEVFGAASDVTSEMIVDDILTRARLKNYSNEATIRMYKIDGRDRNLPGSVNPLEDRSYIQTQFFLDSSENGVIQFYIPITVEGLYNR